MINEQFVCCADDASLQGDSNNPTLAALEKLCLLLRLEANIVRIGGGVQFVEIHL